MLINGNALNIPLADNSVQMIVTSPPYFGLRNYQTASWEGGDSNCDHVANPKATKTFGNPVFNENRPSRENTKTAGYYEYICPKCGAIKIDNQLGLEKLHDCLGWATGNFCGECYVCHMVAVFRECKRVLRDEGTFWLNIGDSYNGSGKGPAGITSQLGNVVNNAQATNKLTKLAALKPKDLIGIPWRVAFALQYDGWYLRQDIIWAKTNPMPESVKDRCTKSHEYLFLFSKSDKYYFDNIAIQEPAVYPNDDRGSRTDARRGTECNSMSGKTGLFRNKRDVWTISSQPTKDAHFATFPSKLVEPCILAGSKIDNVVFDPFCGSGTTGVVCKQHNRQFIGLDLSYSYLHDIGIKKINNAKML